MAKWRRLVLLNQVLKNSPNFIATLKKYQAPPSVFLIHFHPSQTNVNSIFISNLINKNIKYKNSHKNFMLKNKEKPFDTAGN
jgi:hypothetical protein